MSLPWRVGTASCGAYLSSGTGGAPSQCSAPVTHAGLRVGGTPLEAWLAFACTSHAGELRAVRLLLPRDRAVLADWRDREQRGLTGGRWDPPRPLAVGAAATELVARAERATR